MDNEAQATHPRKQRCGKVRQVGTIDPFDFAQGGLSITSESAPMPARAHFKSRINFSKVRSVNIWAITWIWLVDPLRRDQSFRNEPDDDYDEVVGSAFVSYKVPRGFACIDEC